MLYQSVKPQGSELKHLYPVDASRQKRAHFRVKTKQNKFSFQQFKHWVLMLVVLFVIIQCVRSIVSGVYQLIALQANLPVVEQYYQELETENKILSQKIKTYSSPEGIEELARNSLNMVGKNETLVVIH